MAQRIINGEQYEAFLIRGDINGGPVPVAFASGVTISGVTIGAEVEVTNDDGNPLPVSDAGGSLTIDAVSLPLPSGAATEAKQDTGNTRLASIAGLSIPAHDYIDLSYTGTNLSGVVYKTGGVSGSTVGTLALAYSGTSLISVTKS